MAMDHALPTRRMCRSIAEHPHSVVITAKSIRQPVKLCAVLLSLSTCGCLYPVAEQHIGGLRPAELALNLFASVSPHMVVISVSELGYIVE
jgi:hypothetical protein